MMLIGVRCCGAEPVLASPLQPVLTPSARRTSSLVHPTSPAMS